MTTLAIESSLVYVHENDWKSLSGATECTWDSLGALSCGSLETEAALDASVAFFEVPEMIDRIFELFAGLDVSISRTSVSAVDSSGDVTRRGFCATDPESLSATIRRVGADRSARIGLETGYVRD